MRRKLIGFAVMAFAGAACASEGFPELSEKAAARLAEFERTGETESCLGLRRISHITPLNEKLFLVEVGINDYYLNEVSGTCHGADSSFNRLQYSTTTSSLCRNEIIRVVDNSTGFTVGSCGLGDFERLEEKVESDTEEE